MHAGKPVQRPAAVLPLCRTQLGCAKGSPEAPKSLTAQNWQAYAHYKRCAAVARFPDDPLVAENAAVISGVLEEAKQRRELRLLGVK